MENILETAKKIHCIGLNGTGLSALAGILREKGKIISGSDSCATPHDAKNITEGIELVIYSAAVPRDNIERLEADKRGIPQYSYPEALGLMTRQYRTIAICGTHGKTTTTAMTALILKDAIDPTVLVGARVHELGEKNYRTGKGEYLIIEACEYQRHFCNYSPEIVTITNIEFDHPDYFPDENDYRSAFESFISRLPENGTIIANYDDPNVVLVCSSVSTARKSIKIVPFGQDHPYFTQLKLTIPGEHNRLNGVAALLTAQEAGKIDARKAMEQLHHFTGAGRRFEQFNSSSGTIIIDDYAHHPTAIRATLKAAREKFGLDKKILCIFQPHQYSRTIKLFKEFAESFQLADEVIIPNIYKVRDSEQDSRAITPESLVEEIKKHHKKAIYGKGLEKTFYDVQNRIKEFDVIIVMGAGDITTLTARLKSSSR